MCHLTAAAKSWTSKVGSWGEKDQKWEDLADKYEMLERKVAEYFEDQETPKADGPPMVKSHTTPTKEEYQRHQVTHTHTICTLVQTLRSSA